MNPASYHEWSKISGLYLGRGSPLDRYRSYRARLSSAGFTTIVVLDFLADNPVGVDAHDWRRHAVGEQGNDCQERIQLTAEALDAVGAARVADAVRATATHVPMGMTPDSKANPRAELVTLGSLDDSALREYLRAQAARQFPSAAARQAVPSDATGQPLHENRAEINRLVTQFAACHREELEGDLARHGDPRTVPGYTRDRRQAELELLAEQEELRAARAFEAETLLGLMRDIRETMRTTKDMASAIEQLEPGRHRVRDFVKRSKRYAPTELLSETSRALESAILLMGDFPQLFAQAAINDPLLLARLEALGEHEWQQCGHEREVCWESPVGFSGAWGNFALKLRFPTENLGELARLLVATERLRYRIADLAEDWCDELETDFRCFEPHIKKWLPEDYELGHDNLVTLASIVEHAGTGTIHLAIQDGKVSGITTYWVDWDDSSVHEIPWNEELLDVLNEDEAIPPGPDERFTCGAITLSDSGPRLTEEDLAAFEKRCEIRLPRKYRQFLLLHNGGRPEPRYFRLKNPHSVFPTEIAYFLPLYGKKFPDAVLGNVETALEVARKQRIPTIFLLVGRVELAEKPHDNKPNLWLTIAGTQAGQLGLLEPDNKSECFEFPGPHEPIDQDYYPKYHLIPLAKSLPILFQNLQPRITEELPTWLEYLHANNIAEFVDWLEGGGELSLTYQPYGARSPWTVVDFLTKQATPELLKELCTRNLLKPMTLHDSWESNFSSDVARFHVLMPLLDKKHWLTVFQSRNVWDYPDLTGELAAAGVDFNVQLGEEGLTPLHHAVIAGNKAAVKWLLAHGANPRQRDKNNRDALAWAENESFYSCIPLLEGRPEPQDGQAAPDVPGIGTLREAATCLTPPKVLSVVLQIRTPPVTRAEKVLYFPDCHYLLTIDIGRNRLTYKDMGSTRKNDLTTGNWPEILFAPILQWPKLTPLWNTLNVWEFDATIAQKQHDYLPTLRPDLWDAARQALLQAFDASEAAARAIRLRK